jgi:hypothetical protein
MCKIKSCSARIRESHPCTRRKGGPPAIRPAMMVIGAVIQTIQLGRLTRRRTRTPRIQIRQRIPTRQIRPRHRTRIHRRTLALRLIRPTRVIQTTQTTRTNPTIQIIQATQAIRRIRVAETQALAVAGWTWTRSGTRTHGWECLITTLSALEDSDPIPMAQANRGARHRLPPLPTGNRIAVVTITISNSNNNNSKLRTLIK